MSKHSRSPILISPVLWLAPLPFVLAMCMPLDLHRSQVEPASLDRVATVATPSRGSAASAPQAPAN